MTMTFIENFDLFRHKKKKKKKNRAMMKQMKIRDIVSHKHNEA